MGTTVTTSLGTFVASRRKELVLLSLILVALFTLVSMVGWRASDPTLLRDGTGTVDNPCGVVGANVADLMFALLGHGAWVLVPLVGLAVMGLAGRRVLDAVQVVASSFIFLFLLGAFELALRPGVPHPPGGIVGWGVGSGLETAVGTVGAWLVLVGASLLLVTWAARIRWSKLASAAFARLEALAPRVAGFLWSVVVRVWGWFKAALFKVVGLSWGGVRAAGRGTWGLGRRMVASVMRNELADDWEEEPSWEDDPDMDSVWEESMISDISATDATDATQVGQVRALVEAEWEETVAPSPSRGYDSRVESEVLDLFPALAPRSASAVADTPVAAASRVAVPTSTQASVQGDVENTRRSVAEEFRAAGRTPDPADRAEAPAIRPARTSPQPAAPRIDVQVEAEVEDRKPAPVARVALAGSDPSGGFSAVDVRHNKLLDEKVADDGKALREEVGWQLPRLALLDDVPEQRASYDKAELQELAGLLEEKLASFKVLGKVTGVLPGPVVTIFEFLPDPGVKVSRISGLSDDLAMALRAMRVRIVAPIPGRGVVGIEIPSKRRLTVYLREVLASDEFRTTKAALPCVLGKDVEGRPVVADLARMPHLLIGGTTGSGKSVGVNGMLMSMVFTRSPEELRLLLVDPKMLEFEMYSDIPHLLHPVVTEAKVAAQALAWACREMDDRYALLARWGTRNIVSYNKKVERELKSWSREKAHKYAPKGWSAEDGELPTPEKMPYIVIVIDELADLMMVAGKEVEESICRIAQKARACGIHLIVATQRPSVDVVTGLIKANLPTRIAFQLRSRHDSRTVLDAIGAENLLGKGDMLYQPPGANGLSRCHGAFVSDEEVGRVTTFLRDQGEPTFIDSLEEESALEELFDAEEQDELYDAACEVVIQAGKASTSMVQRHLKIGYNRAARIIDAMEAAGLIGPADGARPREVLVSHHG